MKVRVKIKNVYFFHLFARFACINLDLVLVLIFSFTDVKKYVNLVESIDPLGQNITFETSIFMHSITV